MDPFCAPVSLEFKPPHFVAPANDTSLPDPFRQGAQSDDTLFREGALAAHNIYIPDNVSRLTDALATFGESFHSVPMRTTVARFCELGGQFYAAPKLVVSTDGKTILETKFKIHFTNNDLLIPICHEGVNRSQVMFLALHAVAKASGLNPCIGLPHGAESGFDPYQAYKELHLPDNMYGYIHGPMLLRGSEGEWLHDNFHATFKIEKQKRVGQYEFEQSGESFLNPDETKIGSMSNLRELERHRLEQRKRMDKLLYNPDNLRRHLKHRAGKVIIFAFSRAAEIFMKRMLDLHPVCLRNICIVALPWGDNISRAGGADEIEAYRAQTGRSVGRDTLSKLRHVEVFQLYCSILSAMTPGEAASRPPAVLFSGEVMLSQRDLAVLRELADLLAAFQLECYRVYNDPVFSVLEPYVERANDLMGHLKRVKSFGNLVRVRPPSMLKTNYYPNANVQDTYVECVLLAYKLDNEGLQKALINAINFVFASPVRGAGTADSYGGQTKIKRTRSGCGLTTAARSRSRSSRPRKTNTSRSRSRKTKTSRSRSRKTRTLKLRSRSRSRSLALKHSGRFF
jgi:hypothetical protein